MAKMSDFEAVGAFHRKFGLANVGMKFGDRKVDVPIAVPEDVALFRLKFLLEELLEIADGYGFELDMDADGGPEFVKVRNSQELPKVADGLVDLVYVALGTAHLHLLPWSKLFAEVQRANMTKERASHSDDDRSIRKHSLDVVKPANFRPPAIIEVLMEAGWKGPDLPL